VSRGAFARLREALRRYFVAGILVFAPIGITIWATAWIIRKLDDLLLPHVLRWLLPGVEDPPRLFLVGALFTLLVIILLGVVARHLFGGELVRLWERVLSRVPVARNIYGGVKQLFEAIFHADQASRFNRVVLVEYPRKDVYALAFTTGPARGAIQAATDRPMINCFLPTTPNPTSGFYLVVPEDEIREVDLTVEDAFKLVMSAGLVTPEMVARARPRKSAAVSPEPATESR
jgi:uncharacterized membrane protein